MPKTRADIIIEVQQLLTDGVNLRNREYLQQVRDEIARRESAKAKAAPPPKRAPAKKKPAEVSPAAEEPKEPPFKQTYQAWYSKALRVVQQVLPDRYDEFAELYKNPKRKEITWLTYTISDYLLGLRITERYSRELVFDPYSSFVAKVEQQITILASCVDRIVSAVADIEGILQAALFDTELDAARELAKKKHIRAAGALAGVTLERHLTSVVKSRGLALSKKDPTISDLNDVLKKAEIVDLPMWRFIQRLGDLRNLSVHSKEREPTSDEVEELIAGVDKATKTVF